VEIFTISVKFARPLIFSEPDVEGILFDGGRKEERLLKLESYLELRVVDGVQK
jgi:hypothetical protein